MSKSNSTQTSNSIFTSANLPVRILIYISMAGAISLPSYISKYNWLDRIFLSATQAEKEKVKKNVSALNSAQQVYYLENNRLADSISELGIAIQPETSNYHYRIVQPMIPVQDLDDSVTPDSNDSNLSMRMAIAQKNVKDNFKHYHLTNYLSIVYLKPETYASGETEIISTRVTMCKMTPENPLPMTMLPLTNSSDYECPAGSKTWFNDDAFDW